MDQKVLSIYDVIKLITDY